MTEPVRPIVSISDLVTAIERQWIAWCGTVDQLSPEQREQPGTSGDWSVDDLVGHIATWDQFAIDRAHAILRDEPRPTLDVHIDEYNARALAGQHDLTFPERHALMVQTHANLLAVLGGAATASDAPVREIVEESPVDTCDHYRVHRKQVTERFG